MEALYRRCFELKKRSAAAGKKRWSAAFQKNSKDPEAGLPPPRDPSAQLQADLLEARVAEQAAAQQQGAPVVMDPAALLGGHLGGQAAGGVRPPLIQEVGGAAGGRSAPARATITPKQTPSLGPKAAAGEDEDEEEDHNLVETLLGATVLAGAVAAVGMGAMWFMRNRNR